MNIRLLVGVPLLVLAPTTTQAVSLESATAHLTQVPQIYRFDGTTEAVNKSTINAQTSGEVVDILVDVDDVVEKGTLIIRLRDTEQKARHSQAVAELKAANAELEDAQQEHRRISDVFSKKLLSQAAMDKATTTLKTAKARLAANSAALEQATEQLAYTKISAPFSGIVTQRHVEIGEIATPGKPLISGLSLQHLRVSLDVPQSLISDIRHAESVKIQLPNRQQVPAGNTTIFPFANPQTGTFEVRLGLPDSLPDLFPGMRVKVAFELGHRQQLLIPVASVVYRSEVTATYVIDSKDRIHFRHIRTGHPRNDQMITVLSGLEAGERVAVDPIKAGSQLKLQVTSQ